MISKWIRWWILWLFIHICTQIDDYGYRIPQDPAGKTREGHRILQERRGKVTGSCRKALEITGSGSSIPTGTYRIFFRWIPVNSLSFPAGIGRKSSEKIRNFSGGNTASTFQRCPVLSCRNRPVFFDLGHLAFKTSEYETHLHWNFSNTFRYYCLLEIISFS